MPPKASDILSILMPLYGKRGDATAAIEHLAVVPLGRDEVGLPNFYPVREDILLLQPNYVSTILSTLGQSIVPIVAVVPGEDVVRCLGTGFFVSTDGLLITAAHVVVDPMERQYGDVREREENQWSMRGVHLGVMIATNSIFQPRGWVFRSIEWAGLLAERTEHPLQIRGAELKLTADTAICKVTSPQDDWLYQPLTVIQPGIRGLGLAVGKRATAIGYSGMSDFQIDDMRKGKFQFRLHVATGEVLERFPDNSTNQQVSTPGACFSASLRVTGGMSGSPIFDDERIYVHGVVSKGWEDESGPVNFGYGSMLAHSLRMPIKFMGDKSLIDLMKDCSSGVTVIRIPDA